MRRKALLSGALAAGLALRIWWILHFGQTTNDTRVYGEFAKNLLQHGVYGWTNIVKGVLRAPQPTLIRLPGYPLFLLVCFRLFGVENYTAVMLVQTAVDLWTCLLLGGLAARMFGRRAGLAALWMGALCPFMANYVAAPLTEALTLWCIVAAFYGLVRWKEAHSPVRFRGMGERAKVFLVAGVESKWIDRWVFAIGFALAYAILLRPEQGLLAAAVVPAMLWIGRGRAWPQVALVCLLTVLPLAPWTVRNWHTFHVFQPLAPRYATDPGDRINYGFQRWYRTWGVEFMSTETVYWNYDGNAVQISDLPDRAFDSNAQYAATDALLKEYDDTDNASYALDAHFDAIAKERIHAHPLRYYFALPVARLVNMMFRPRTEMLPVPLEWWKFKDHKGADWFALGYALLNAGFFALALVTLARRSAWSDPVVWAMVATIVMRMLLLLTLDNSEDRYTLEFYPVVIVLGSAVLGGKKI